MSIWRKLENDTENDKENDNNNKMTETENDIWFPIVWYSTERMWHRIRFDHWEI